MNQEHLPGDFSRISDQHYHTNYKILNILQSFRTLHVNASHNVIIDFRVELLVLITLRLYWIRLYEFLTKIPSFCIVLHMMIWGYMRDFANLCCCHTFKTVKFQTRRLKYEYFIMFVYFLLKHGYWIISFCKILIFSDNA